MREWSQQQQEPRMKEKLSCGVKKFCFGGLLKWTKLQQKGLKPSCVRRG